MTRPFVIDADAFKKIFDDLVANSEGVGKQALNLILTDDHILLDRRGAIKQQWRNCSCGDDDEYFSTWVAQRLVEDKIREVDFKRDGSLRSKLNKFGMPQDDRVYLFVAASNDAYGIVSEDSDLYDPKAKRWGPEEKRKLRERGGSCVARYMRRQFGVEIFPLHQTSRHCPA